MKPKRHWKTMRMLEPPQEAPAEYVVVICEDGSWTITTPHITKSGRTAAGYELDGGERLKHLFDAIKCRFGDEKAGRRRDKLIEREDQWPPTKRRRKAG